MGGKNPFLGIAYVVVGGLCVVLGAIFAIRHLFKPRFVTYSPIARYEVVVLKLYCRKLGDHTYLSWNNDQPSTATASGREVRGE